MNRSTIGRELKRNGSPCRGQYQADRSQEKARRRIPGVLWQQVEALLRQRWSPQQISQWRRKEGCARVSHERIYPWILEDKHRGGHLYQCLRHCRGRRKRYGSAPRGSTIPNRIPIEQRPAIVAHRLRLGDWKADTIIGRGGNGVLVSLTEWRPRLIRLAPLARRKALAAANRVIGLRWPLARRFSP